MNGDAELLQSKLSVELGKPERPTSKGRATRSGKVKAGQEMPNAWYVAVDCDGEPKYLHMPFRRQRDAEMAKAALEKAGVNCADELIRVGIDEYERIMIESLAW